MVKNRILPNSSVVVLVVVLVGCCLLDASASSSDSSSSSLFEPLQEFHLWTPEELNVTLPAAATTTNTTNNTDTNWGYNPWMEQYSYRGADPTGPYFLLLASACIPEEEGGSRTMGDMAVGFWKTCTELDMNCQCRPIVKYNKWNVDVTLPNREEVGYGIYQGMHHCSWETRRALDEHRRGLIKLAGISTRCGMQDPLIYEEARQLGVTVFVNGMNPPVPGQEEYGWPEPDGFIGVDEELYGRTMAKSLKQLVPQGGTYGFVMQWTGDSNNRRRNGFNREMMPKLRDDDDDDPPVWMEVETYPYEHPYNNSVPCNHLTCQMEGLVQNRTVNALIFLFESPIRNPLYKEWVDNNRWRNLTLLSEGSTTTGSALEFLNTGYLDGMYSILYYEYGVLSARRLYETYTKVENGQVTLPLEANFFESRTLAYSVIPTDLDKSHPIQLDQNLLGNLSYVGFGCFGIVLVSALGCAVWTFINRSAVVVRSAQPFFLFIVAAGVIIFCSTVIPLSLDDGGDPDAMSESFAVGICMSQPWLAFIGFSIIFAALFSKTWRVNKLFDSKTVFSRTEVSRTDVLAPFAVIFTCNVIVLICWTVIDPLTYQRLVGDGTDLWNREFESYGACRSNKALAFLIPLAVINFMVLGIACWQAFEARNTHTAFSETRYIALSVICLFQAFLIGFPVLVIVEDEPRAFYLVLTLLMFALSEGILLLIFLPKMFFAYKCSKMTPREQKQMISDAIHESAARSSNVFQSPDGKSSDRVSGLGGSGIGGSRISGVEASAGQPIEHSASVSFHLDDSLTPASQKRRQAAGAGTGLEIDNREDSAASSHTPEPPKTEDSAPASTELRKTDAS
mmetsp:Transcript_19639/g.47404  ORF Transcript_19639/g.47404 Transcript_19639/m.47404 type:complete len:848 (-) Transcript_19639:23-2566(-)